MSQKVDPYRFVDRLTRRVVEAWIEREPPVDIPWTPLTKPLADCYVAVVSSAGVALKTDRPFDQQGEHDNPWWGDPSYRIVPRAATAADISVYHLHIDPQFAEADLNCVFPLERLAEMEAAGEICRLADFNYSMMGYILRPEKLMAETVPQIIAGLQAQSIDVVLLVPV